MNLRRITAYLFLCTLVGHQPYRYAWRNTPCCRCRRVVFKPKRKLAERKAHARKWWRVMLGGRS